MFNFTLSEDGKYYILTSAGDNLPNKVEIPAVYEGLPVKEIGAKAFFKKSNIKRIDLPEGIIKIGEYAFSYITSLEEIFFNEGVEEICDNAFAMCENLEEVYLPDTLKTVGMSAFSCCKKLAEINVVNVTLIKNNAFDFCESLKKIVFNKTSEKKKLYGACFKDCTSLEEVVFNSSVIIYNSAFENTGIEDLEIPDDSELSKNSFANCKNLQSITFGKNVTLSNYGIANDSRFDFDPIFFSAKVEDEPIFNGCENVKTVVLKGRNPYAFKELGETVEEIILDGVETIEKGDLKYCSKVRKLVITPSVKKICAGALGFASSRLTVDELVGDAGLDRYNKVICPYLADVVLENFKGWKAVLPNSKKAIKIKDKILKDRKKTLEFLMDKYMDYDWINETKFSDKMKK